MSLTVSSTESNLSHNKDNERDELLEGLTLIPYHERVTRFIRGSTIHWFAGRVTVVDSRPLYTATVHHLQRRLAEETQKTAEDVMDQQLDGIRETLIYSRPLV